MLRSDHVFGRDTQRVDTVLNTAEASSLHAVARWRGQRWELVDFSRNGTLLGGARLERGEPAVLAAGMDVGFGQDDAWDVVDVSPPGPALMPLHDGVAPLPLRRDLNLLSTAEDAPQALYEEEQGVWVLEENGQRRHLREGDTLTFQGRQFSFFPGEGCDETLELAPSQAEPLRLSFQVSLDEEHTCLQLSQGPLKVSLGERVHHYTLLTLARQRLADTRQGLEAPAQGWLERGRLARMLGMDVGHLNIQIHRVREQLQSSWPTDGATARIIETRRGGLRLGDVDIDILRGSRMEGWLRGGRADPP